MTAAGNCYVCDASPVTTVVVKSPVLRTISGIGLGLLGLPLFLLLPFSGGAFLPGVMLLWGLSWWLLTGAEDPPPRWLGWVIGIGAAIIGLLLVAGIVIVIAQRI